MSTARGKKSVPVQKVALVPVPIHTSNIGSSSNATDPSGSNAARSHVHQPPSLPSSSIHTTRTKVPSLASHQRGGWKEHATNAPVAKIDTGRRRIESNQWTEQPKSYHIPITQTTEKSKTNKPNDSESKQVEHIIVPRTGATKILQQPAHHTPIVHSEIASTSLQPPNSHVASSASLHPSSSTASLTSPRRRKAQLTHAASTAIFTNSHHFNALAVPTPQPPLTVPIILIPTLEEQKRHQPHASTERLREPTQSSSTATLATAASTSRLLYDPVNSTLQHLQVPPALRGLSSGPSVASLHPSASNGSFAVLSPSASDAHLLNALELVPQLSIEKHYFSPEWGQNQTARRPGEAAPSGMSSQSNLHLNLPGSNLQPSASVGALPFGMSPSASYSTMPVERKKGTQYQSSPSMPRFGVGNPADSPSTGSLHENPQPYYPAEHTIDNRAMIASVLRDMIKERGYRYRARGKGGEVIQGHLHESSGEEEDERPRKRRRRKSKKPAVTDEKPETKEPASAVSIAVVLTSRSKGKGSHVDAHGYPRASWDKKGFETISSSMPFDLLFGHEDAATKMRRKKREQRVEQQRAQREYHRQSERHDDEQAHLVRDGGAGKKKTEDGVDPSQDDRSHPSNVLVPSDLANVSTQALEKHSSVRPSDPLDPHPKPSLLTAATRVLLRKELHAPQIDANQVKIETVAVLPKSTAVARPKGVHDLLTAKTSLEDDDPGAPEGAGQEGGALVQSKHFDASRARGTFLEHSSRMYNASSTRHGSHNAQTHAQQVHAAKRDLKMNMESWLRVRARRHQKLLKEEDRLRAREMFDMLLLAANGAAGHGLGSKTHNKGGHDPANASIELEAMRRALKGLGMDSSTEELAFRLQKLSEHHATIRANAQAGISSKGHAGGTNVAPQTLHLTFPDFLAVYEHISQWDELAEFKKLKIAKERKAGAKSARSKGGNTDASESEGEWTVRQTARSLYRSPNLTSNKSLATLNEHTSTKHLRRTSSMSFTLAGEPISPRSQAAKHLTRATSGVVPFTMDESLPLGATRTDENLKRIQLPFFLWVPAAHRAERINEMVRLYGQPSLVGVGIGFEADTKDDTAATTDATAAAQSKSPRKFARRGMVASSSKTILKTRTRRPAKPGGGDDSDGSSDGAGGAGGGHSSSDDEALLQPDEVGPRSIVRTLIDELNPGRIILPTILSAQGATNNTGGTKPRKQSIVSVAGGSLIKKKKKSTPAGGSTKPAGSYWGSQQVLRALHYKNLALSSSTLQTNRVLTHETVSPATQPPATPVSASPSASPQVPRTPRTPSAATKRTLFVSPLNGAGVAIPEGDSVESPALSPSSHSVSSSVIVNVSDDSAVPQRKVSTPVRELQRAMHERADQTDRAIHELIREVEAKLAGKELEGAEPAEIAATDEAGEPTKEVAAVETVAIPKPVTPISEKTVSPEKSTAHAPSVSLTAAIRGRRRSLIAGATLPPFPPPAAKEIEQATLPTHSKDKDTKESRSTVHHDEDKSEVMQLTDPIIKAAKSGAWEDVLMLIQTSAGDNVKLRNAYVNRRDKNGSSAIFHCVWPGHFKVLEVLLYHGADPNITNNRLNTALHLCCEKGHRKLIRLLIEMGAAIDIRNWQNKTCLDCIPIEEVETETTPTVTIVPAGSTAASEPSAAALDKAMRSHAAADASDSLKAFVIECAAEARKKKEAEKAESGGLGTVAVSASTGQSDFTSFAEYSSRRDAAAAASLAANVAAATSLSLLGPDGKPAVDLWELTAADRRSAGLRGNFFGSDALQHGGQEQSKTLTGQLLIHTVESAKGLSANKNAMGAYKASFVSMNDPLAQETRSRIVAGLVREELAHSSLHALWTRTLTKVQSRKTVISSTEDLLMQNGSRMEELRQSMAEREQKVVNEGETGAFVKPKETSNRTQNIFQSK